MSKTLFMVGVIFGFVLLRSLPLWGRGLKQMKYYKFEITVLNGNQANVYRIDYEKYSDFRMKLNDIIDELEKERREDVEKEKIKSQLSLF